MRRFPVLLMLSVLAVLSTSMVSAQVESPINNSSVNYTFGNGLHFSIELDSDINIDETQIFIQYHGFPNTINGVLNKTDSGVYQYSFDFAAQPLRAFTTVTYWYLVKYSDGSEFHSEPASFLYEDNRFDWQVQENGSFTVHWYEGDEAFAQSIMDAAKQGIDHIQGMFQLPIPEHIDIYAYASAVDLQSTLRSAGQDLIAGHADPDLGVILVSLPQGPGQTLEIKRQIPHEMMHILLYEFMGSGYQDIPQWLNEGLATMAELFPNPDYQDQLNQAAEADELIPISGLCNTFPTDPSNFLLAYAQSTSFTRYLHHQYGSKKLLNLLDQYRDDVSCERGMEIIFNKSLLQLENNWLRQEFRNNAMIKAVLNLLPWLVVLGIVLAVPLSLMIRKPAKDKKWG